MPASSEKTTAHYDLAVIGSGPGGEGAAIMAAKSGRRVAVVESYPEVGGGCTHWGTIPSKALRHSVQRLTEFAHNPLFRELGRARTPTYPELLHAADNVIRQQTAQRRRYYERNHIRLVRGHARFENPQTLVVETPEGNEETLGARHFVIATGSRPYRPPEVDFTHPCVHDSDSILKLDYSPRTVCIYGAGVIGCEYASIFAHLGIKVNLVNTQAKLLSFLDDEITDALSYHLREQGVIIRHQEQYRRVEGREHDVVLHLESGKHIRCDLLLWANGRTGNTDRLGLERLPLAVNPRGQLSVNENYQTALPHVYAVGDVIGPPALASAAYDQGRFAATHIVQGRCDHSLSEFIPTGIYTIPEISSVGRTERELTEASVPYEVGHAHFRHLARAQMTDQTVGMLKLLFHPQTLEILGIHCFGDRASEIVHIGQAIMASRNGGNSLQYFLNTTFNYPTMAEAYRVAALNGYNRLD
ncbi:MAG TPA: Si-specific NAD(P)(+) transhydrogenase [Nevskiales bacterium]|nr:Si-specific NAD(P)(+) transhydrogenase [Nevskiales bacterium]